MAVEVCIQRINEQKHKTSWHAAFSMAGRDGICGNVWLHFWPVTKLGTIEMQLNFQLDHLFRVNKMGTHSPIHSPEFSRIMFTLSRSLFMMRCDAIDSIVIIKW